MFGLIGGKRSLKKFRGILDAAPFQVLSCNAEIKELLNDIVLVIGVDVIQTGNRESEFLDSFDIKMGHNGRC